MKSIWATVTSSTIAFTAMIYMLFYAYHTNTIPPIIPRNYVIRDTLGDPNIQAIIIVASIASVAIGKIINELWHKLQKQQAWRRIRVVQVVLWAGFVLAIPFLLLVAILFWILWPPRYISASISGHTISLVETSDWDYTLIELVVVRQKDNAVAVEFLDSSSQFPYCVQLEVQQVDSLYTFSCVANSRNDSGLTKTVRIDSNTLIVSSALTSRIIRSRLDQLEYRAFP